MKIGCKNWLFKGVYLIFIGLSTMAQAADRPNIVLDLLG